MSCSTSGREKRRKIFRQVIVTDPTGIIESFLFAKWIRKVEGEKFAEDSHQREYNWEISGYDDEPEEEKKQNHDQAGIGILKFQTLAADVLLDGAFNVNSTSADAWVSQLSMRRQENFLPMEELSIWKAIKCHFPEILPCPPI